MWWIESQWGITAVMLAFLPEYELLRVLILILVVTGAGVLFRWAYEQAFVGVAVYFACWIFLFPLMLVACFVAAIVWGIQQGW